MTRPATIVLLLLCLPVTGCGGNDAQDRLQDYLQRLARPLGDTAAAVAGPVAALPPRAAALQIPLAGGNLDGLDFLRLRGCALQDTVARRNSSLGKVAPPSQRLLLELAFLRDAPACIDYMQEKDHPELAALLAENYRRKSEQLPALIFNATLGNREFRDFWRAGRNLADYPAQTSSAVIAALESVNADIERWLAGDYTADGSRLELALSEIARGDGGELLQALRLQSAFLQAGNELIERRLSRGPLCSAGLEPAAAPVLRTVVRRYFIGAVQPWSADLNQRYHALLGPVTELETLLATQLPEEYRRWRIARDAELEAALAAPAQHVQHLQSLLGTCYAEFRQAAPPDAGRATGDRQRGTGDRP